ncbi:MAG: hypothetical protein EPN21_19105 [Methylococcaceae bacterium]|nr:MAG: hypothetical protein EPN21_19105 [Methylococcaceae bacterium]
MRRSRRINSCIKISGGIIVPTVSVGTHPATLCVAKQDAERPRLHSHAERGNDYFKQHQLPSPHSASRQCPLHENAAKGAATIHGWLCF